MVRNLRFFNPSSNVEHQREQYSKRQSIHFHITFSQGYPVTAMEHRRAMVMPASEAEGEEMVPTSTCGQLKEDLFTVYTVPQVVRIRAPPLQICYLITFSLCATVMLCWLILTLQLFEFNEISISNSFVRLAPPWANSKSLCYDYDYDCSDSPEAWKPHYCDKAALTDLAERIHINFFQNGTFSKSRWLGGAPRINADCRYFDVHETLEEEGPPMVMTARTKTLQDRCASPAQEKCIWHNQGFDIDLVQNVEGFFLKIRHDVMASKVKASNSYSTGFLKIQGKEYQLPCSSEGSCDKKDFMSLKNVPSCNVSDCWSNKYFDYLSMDLILKAANLSLDSHIPLPSETDLESGSDLPRRFLGTSVGIDVKYENVHPGSIYPWQWYEFRKRYTYTFRKMGDYASETDLRDVSDTRRLFIRKSGIKVFVSFDGELASWSWSYAVKQLAIMQVVFTLTMIVVDKVILQTVFKFFPDFSHLPPMKKYYSELNTPAHHEFRKAQSASHLMSLIRDTNQQRFREMRKAFTEELPDDDSD
eukprot:s180_g52.t1